MSARDGTQERTLDPPDNTLSDAQMRACERAARDGFDEMDERATAWLNEQLADTPKDAADVARMGLVMSRFIPPAARSRVIEAIRARYIAECAEEYWGDLIEQEKYAQEP